jgi:putative membrane protein
MFKPGYASTMCSLAAAALAWAGCGDNNALNTGVPDAAVTVTVDAAHGAVADAALQPDAAVATPASDGEIVAAVDAALSGQIESARVASARSTNAAVKSYADQVDTADTNAAQQLTSLGIPPKQSALSETLQAVAAADLQTLEATSPARFDTVYLNQQVLRLEQFLGLLDGTLIPAATQPQLRSFLQGTLRPLVQTQLAAAESIRATLPRAPTFTFHR